MRKGWKSNAVGGVYTRTMAGADYEVMYVGAGQWDVINDVYTIFASFDSADAGMLAAERHAAQN